MNKLPRRKLELAKLLASGCSNKEAADKMGLTEGTVANYRAKIYRALGVHDTASLAHYALHQGWIKNQFA